MTEARPWASGRETEKKRRYGAQTDCFFACFVRVRLVDLATRFAPVLFLAAPPRPRERQASARQLAKNGQHSSLLRYDSKNLCASSTVPPGSKAPSDSRNDRMTSSTGTAA